MDIAASEAIWLLPPALPVALFIAYGDLKFMKITNAAVLLMAGIFLFFGFIALPFYGWLWQIAQMLIMLLVGILAHGLRLMGGGRCQVSGRHRRLCRTRRRARRAHSVRCFPARGFHVSPAGPSRPLRAPPHP